MDGNEADAGFPMFPQLRGGRWDDPREGEEGEDESQTGKQESVQLGGKPAGDSAAAQEPEPAGPAQVQHTPLLCWRYNK